MAQELEQSEHKQRIASLFNLVSPGYDDAALRFFPFCADRLVDRLDLGPGRKVLDVATGTGVVAVSAAQRVRPGGRVTGIDIAAAMLDRAYEKARLLAVDNLDLHVMDAERLEFRRDYFDAVACSFGIFFLTDMAAAVREWLRVTRPGGRVAFSCFAAETFTPMASLFKQRLARHGIDLTEGAQPPAWERLYDPQACRRLLEEAGATDVEVTTEQLGYHLADAEDWWRIVWNSGFRGFVSRLAADEQDAFKQEHLREVAELATDNGIWLEVQAHIASGRKPARR